MSKNTGGGGGQGDFDNVQIEADFFPGWLPLARAFSRNGDCNIPGISRVGPAAEAEM